MFFIHFISKNFPYPGDASYDQEWPLQLFDRSVLHHLIYASGHTMANTFIKVISFLCILLFNVIDGQKINPSTVCAKCPYDNNYILGVIVFSVLVTIAIVFLTLVLIYFLNRIKLINIGKLLFINGC